MQGGEQSGDDEGVDTDGETLESEGDLVAVQGGEQSGDDESTDTDGEPVEGENNSPHAQKGEQPDRGGAITEDKHVGEKEPTRQPGKRGREWSGNSGAGSPPSPRPELVCQYVSRNWEVFLSAEDESPIEAVCLENGNQKRYLDITDRKKCPIPSLRGHLTVKYGNDEERNISLFEGKPLIFKLRKDWKGVGRRIPRVTSGHFILITHKTHEREGRSFGKPESCTDSDFRVHFLYVTKPGEDLGSLGGEEIPSAQIIKLTGKNVFDDSEEGDLFIENAPVLEESQEVLWARIGEEGKNGWGENFKPRKRHLSEVLGNRKGWFFLRVYDYDTELIDSVPFRYSHNLGQILINGEEYTEDMVFLPTSTGHPLTEIRFVSVDGATIRPRLLNRSGGKLTPSGTIEIPPNTKTDTIKCALESFGSEVVRLELNLQQVWWMMKYDDNKTCDWQDTPIIMTRQEFSQQARNKGARICLSLEKFERLFVGFGNDLEREYSKSKISNTDIPLKDFIDFRQIDDRLEHDTYLNVRCDDKWAKEILSIICVRADSAEAAKKTNKEKEVIKCKPDNRFPARVRRNQRVQCGCNQHEWRNGRGFSRREIKEVGLKWKGAVCVRRDRRRRSSYSANVEKIRRVLDDRQH